MRKILLIVSISLLFVKCTYKGRKRNFFIETNGYPNFKNTKGNLPLFGLDSLIIDSLSTSIDKKDYWYMNTSANGLINLNGYLRLNNKIIYIKVGDRESSKNVQEQVFLDFSNDTSKSYSIKYERNNGVYNLRLIKTYKFYNQLIKDSVIVFQVYSEIKDASFSKKFLLQVSLKKGFVSVRHLVASKRRVYTIDYLPSAKIAYDSVTTPLYQMQ